MMIIAGLSNNSVVQAITVTIVFVLVLALTYFTTRYIGSYQKKHMSHGNIKIIESYRLSGNKVLEIVKTGDKCFLVAVCKDTVNLIGEVNEDTLILKSEKSTAESFGSVFNRFKITGKEEKKDAEEE